MENKRKNKRLLLGAVLLVALIAVFAVIFTVFRAKPAEGSKHITIEVVSKAQESTIYELSTDAEYLRQAMDEAEGLTYEGSESEYGLTIMSVNGENADYNTDAAYWAFYVNEEYCNYGVDSQPVYDGDAFRIVYTAAQW